MTRLDYEIDTQRNCLVIYLVKDYPEGEVILSEIRISSSDLKRLLQNES